MATPDLDDLRYTHHQMIDAVMNGDIEESRKWLAVYEQQRFEMVLSGSDATNEAQLRHEGLWLEPGDDVPPFGGAPE